MRLVLRPLIAVALATATVSCARMSAPVPADTSKDVAAIDTVRSDYAAAYNSGDVNKLITLYASDAVMMQEHQPAVVGAENIRKALEGTMSQFTTSLTLRAEETKVTGDMAFDRGTFKLALTPKAPGGAGMNENGKYLVLLQKGADGAWKLAREIGNTSDPMPMPAPAPATKKK
jgi:uncharacterized protein (TIGR02246 family)